MDEGSATTEDQAISSLQKVEIKEGDMLVCHDFNPSQFEKLRRAAKQLKLPKVPVLFLDGDATIETVSEETMKAKGWVRASGNE